MTGRYVLGSSCRKRQRNLCGLWYAHKLIQIYFLTRNL